MIDLHLTIRDEFDRVNKPKRWFTTPVCHGELAFASWDYQLWLEEEIIKTRAELSKIKSLHELNPQIK